MNKLILIVFIFAISHISAQRLNVLDEGFKKFKASQSFSGVQVIESNTSSNINLGNPHYKTKINEPWVVINGVVSLLKSPILKSENIDKVKVYKNKAILPANLMFLERKLVNGIIEIHLKPEVSLESMVLSQYNKDFQFPINQSIYVDEIEMDDTSILIDSSIIKEINWIEINGQKHVVLYTTPKIFKEVE